jgi:tripartite-type tricarboxylate transporter receptor subunit TctC
VTLGNEGPRTFGGMISRVFAARAKIELNQVAYASVSVAVQDTVGGHTDAVMADLPATVQLIKSGRLRVLAVTTSKRLAGFETVPTLSESLPGLEMIGWFGIVAPAGTPAGIVQRANHDINALLAEPEFSERILAIGPLPDSGMSPDQFTAFLRAEHTRWAAATKEIGVLPE